jgi:TRAP-type mannitol/chloroaromatic compound transport system substrate-binding protein
MRAAAQAANSDMLAKYDALNPDAIRALVASGAQLRPFSQEIMETSYNAATAGLHGALRQQCGLQDTVRSMIAYRNDAYLWFQVSEYTADTS